MHAEFHAGSQAGPCLNQPLLGIREVWLQLQGALEVLQGPPAVAHAELGPAEPIVQTGPVGSGREAPLELFPGLRVVPEIEERPGVPASDLFQSGVRAAQATPLALP